MKSCLDNKFEMPDKMVAMLIRFLEQNHGKISKRARDKEFNLFSEGEVSAIEKKYRTIFIE